MCISVDICALLSYSLPTELSGSEQEEKEEANPRRAEDRPTNSRKRRPFIGHHVLNEYQEDHKVTDVPSWVTPGPIDLGKKGHGKLSADAWRVVSTVHMFITLVRLWGWSNPSSLDFQRLANYMDLVTCISFATRRTTSFERRRTAQLAINQYLRSLQLLFDTKVETNQHMATHLPQFLRRLGPPHSWWAFFFERDNGILQAYSTNSIFGECFTPINVRC